MTLQNADLTQLYQLLSQNQTYLSKISGIKPWFALNPPKGGFKKKSKAFILSKWHSWRK